MLLKLSWYQFKLDSYKFKMLSVIPMETNNKITKIHTEKEINRETKWYTRINEKQKAVLEE